MSAARYEIRITGGLGPRAAAVLEDLEARPAADDTVLEARFPDQAALHDALARVCDLHLEVVDVRRVPEPRGGSLT